MKKLKYNISPYNIKMSSLLNDYVKLLRLPGLGGLATPTLFGAISAGVMDIHLLGLVFLIGAFSVIFGFILNDYADVEVDRQTKDLYERPLVKGTISKKTALLICIICLVGAYLTIFLLLYGSPITEFRILAVICISISAVLGSLYDFYSKKIVGSDFLVAISEFLLVLFGALIVTQENTINVITWIIAILTFNQLLYMNAVDGGVKDADHDYKQNVKNIAAALGVKVKENMEIIIPSGFKAFGIGIRCFSGFLVFVPFLFYGYKYEIYQILLLFILIVLVMISTLRLLNLKKFDRDKIKKIISAEAYLRYSLVPIMLISVVGLLWSMILIIFPIVWYILLAPLSGEELFKPRM